MYLKRVRTRLVFSTAILCLFVAVAPAQDEQDAPSEAVQRIAEGLGETSVSELPVLLAPLSTDELMQLSDIAITQVRAVANDLSAALIAQQRAHRQAGEDDDGAIAAADEKVTALLEQKASVVSRTDLVLDALKSKGGDVESARAYVAVVRAMQPQLNTTHEPSVEMTEEERQAAELARTVSEAIAEVRDELPIHERPQPWTVPVSELELELQPLRMADVEERVQKWLEILQREVRNRIRIDIAVERVEGSAQRTLLAERSAEQQEVVQAVVRHVEAALKVLQKRGGEVNEYQSYIATATGQRLNLTDPGVLFAQAMAWVKSRDGGIKVGLNILKALGILLAFFILSRIVGRAVLTAVNRIPKTSNLLRKFLVGLVRKVVMVIGLVIAAGALGINITPLIAAIGAAGLVIGLALQGTLSNFASGILILIYRPFDVGDFINGGGVTGKVDSMNLVSTSILTPDNQVLIVPNNQIWNGVITNITGRDTRRIDLVFGIGYGDDIALAVKLLEDELTSHEKVLKDPAPVVRVNELGDNSVNIIARPWSRTSDYWDVYWDLMRSVKERFDAEGINIPYPQRDLHLPGSIEVHLAGPTSNGQGPASGSADNSKRKLVAVHEPAPGGDDDDDDDNPSN